MPSHDKFDGATRKRVEQVQINAAVSEATPLPRQLHEQLAAFYDEQVAANIRGPY